MTTERAVKAGSVRENAAAGFKRRPTRLMIDVTGNISTSATATTGVNKDEMRRICLLAV
jgi:hypothetical protein